MTRGELRELVGALSGESAEGRVRGRGRRRRQEAASEASDETIVEQLEKALKVESFRDAVRSVAEVLQVGRARVYELGLKLKRK